MLLTTNLAITLHVEVVMSELNGTWSYHILFFSSLVGCVRFPTSCVNRREKDDSILPDIH